MDRVIVEGVNMGPRSIKGDKDKGIPGKVIQLERTMHYSNVQLVDPIQGIPTRIFKKILPSGEKVRISKKSGAIIPKPDVLKMRKKPISSIVTESCTSEDDAWVLPLDQVVQYRDEAGDFDLVDRPGGGGDSSVVL